MTCQTNGAPIAAWVNGRLEACDKLDVHRRGLRHPAVSVFLTVGAQTLLQRRALGKYHTPGLWANSCCTHPHWGESPRDCAIRRVQEELGLSGIDPRFMGQVEYRADVGGGLVEHELVDIYRAEIQADQALSPDRAEVMDVRWITPDRLKAEVLSQPDRFTPWLRIYVLDHAQRILGG
ncbi:MAG: isopentenyl-diphosphate Delta-isomerase [Rhodobacteraceae bacterium]|nr:isopentenyl-diphosphate Delta-isomerase [Paracoccaceae bacterium]